MGMGLPRGVGGEGRSAGGGQRGRRGGGRFGTGGIRPRRTAAGIRSRAGRRRGTGPRPPSRRPGGNLPVERPACVRAGRACRDATVATLRQWLVVAPAARSAARLTPVARRGDRPDLVTPPQQPAIRPRSTIPPKTPPPPRAEPLADNQ